MDLVLSIQAIWKKCKSSEFSKSPLNPSIRLGFRRFKNTQENTGDISVATNSVLQLLITSNWSFLKRFEIHLVKSGFCQDGLSSTEQVRNAFPEKK